jgi:hypothetical protein
MRKLTVLLILISGCNIIDPPTHVSEKLAPFVELVHYEANIRGVRIDKIKVVLGDLGGRNGTFKRSVTGDQIIIDRAFFLRNVGHYDATIEKTVLHEFGHFIGKGHGGGYIMTPRLIVNSGDWRENREIYLNELFGKIKDQ